MNNYLRHLIEDPSYNSKDKNELQQFYSIYKRKLSNSFYLSCQVIYQSKFYKFTKLKELQFSNFFINSLSYNGFIDIINRLNISKTSLLKNRLSNDLLILLGINSLGVHLELKQYNKIIDFNLITYHSSNNKQNIYTNPTCIVIGILLLKYFSENKKQNSNQKTNCQKVMCPQITDNKSYRKWMLENHPDKEKDTKKKTQKTKIWNEKYNHIKECKNKNNWCDTLDHQGGSSEICKMRNARLKRLDPIYRSDSDSEYDTANDSSDEDSENDEYSETYKESINKSKENYNSWVKLKKKIHTIIFFILDLSKKSREKQDTLLSSDIITKSNKKNSLLLLNRKVDIHNLGIGTLIGRKSPIIFGPIKHIIKLDDTGKEVSLVLGNSNNSCLTISSIFRFVRQHLDTSDRISEMIDLITQEPFKTNEVIVYLGRDSKGIPIYPAVTKESYSKLLRDTTHHPLLRRLWKHGDILPRIERQSLCNKCNHLRNDPHMDSDNYIQINRNCKQCRYKYIYSFDQRDPRIDRYNYFPEISEIQKTMDDKGFLSSNIPHYQSIAYQKLKAKRKMDTSYGKQIYAIELRDHQNRIRDIEDRKRLVR